MRVKEAAVPVCAFAEKLRLKHLGYSQPRLQRTEYRIAAGKFLSADLVGKGILNIKPRLQHAINLPLIVDLQGAFDRINAKELKTRIDSYLKKNRGNLAINFSGVTSVERDALLRFFKKLKGNKKRIKIISIDSLHTEKVAVLAYARHYFDVFMDVESLTSSPA